MHTIDLNCDMGEGIGPNEGYDQDIAVMDYVSSVNIACGFHAGSPSIMERTVQAADQRNIAIGAHPGLPDKENFGRKSLPISPAEAYQITCYQIGALHAFTRACGTRLHHVKPHGALYNMAATDFKLAQALAQAIADFDRHLILYGLSGSELIRAGKQIGLPVAQEVFGDRTYQEDGTLTPRMQANSLIEKEEAVREQLLAMVLDQEVKTLTGRKIRIVADTICIHGDGAHALPFAKAIHQSLQQATISIQALSQ